MIAATTLLLLSGPALAAASQYFGAWYFVANGVSTVPNSDDPVWLPKGINMASLAFINPAEIQSMGTNALPAAYVNHASKLQQQGVEVVFSIGGAAFENTWTWLASADAAAAAAQVCANWSLTYNVGIEIDYEGPASQSGYSINWQGAVTVSNELANLGVFIETFRKLVPFGTKLLTMDVFAAQGGGPGLTWLINTYLADMPSTNPSWITSGTNSLKMAGLDFINIMVAGGDSATETIGYMQGYAGPNAGVATQWNPERINAAVPANRAVISMIASNHCGASIDSDLNQVITYMKSGSTGSNLRGIMFWAVAPFGCPGPQNDPVLRIGDWTCDADASCPAFQLGLNALVGQAIM